MAMLAEPRRKQRIGPNPRGKFFSEDEDNRGRNLLQKLGWKNGDGLGVQKQGIVEPVKPKIQMNSNGLGFDIKTDPWMEHSKAFAAVLENLQTAHGADEDNKEDVRAELETQSKHSRSRIHYHKFTRGKDLSSITTKDWSCIFGNNVQLTTSGDSNSEETTFSSGQGDSADESRDVTVNEENVKPVVEDLNTVNMGSMHDYFKIKMAEKLAAIKTRSSIKIETVDCLSPAIKIETEDCASSAINEIVEASIQSDDISGVKAVDPKKKVKKRKHAELDVSIVVSAEMDETVECKREKKKKKCRTVEILEPSSVTKVEIDEDESGPLKEVREKKKKHRTVEMVEPSIVIKVEIGEDEPDPLKEVREKKKKYRTVEMAEPSIVINVDVGEDDSKKKVKKRKHVELNVSIVARAENDETVKCKREKKKKKCRTVEIVEPPSDTNKVEGDEDESGAMNEVWEKKKSRFLAPEEIREVQNEFKGSNLSKIRGYGLY